MWRATMIAALAVFLMACGGGNGEASGAVDAFEGFIEHINRGQYGRAWDNLHPAQQTIVTREDYIQCRGDDSFEIEIIEILEEYDEEVPIAGTDLVVASTAITAEVRISSGLFEDTSMDTIHQILVDGEWRWILSDPNDYDPETC